MNKKYNFLPICFFNAYVYTYNTHRYTHIWIVYVIIITYKLIKSIHYDFMERIKPFGYVVTFVMICSGFLSCFVQILLALVTAVIWPLPSTLFLWPSSVFSTEFTQNHLNAVQIYWSRAVVSGEPPCFPLTVTSSVLSSYSQKWLQVLLFFTFYYSASEKKLRKMPSVP